MLQHFQMALENLIGNPTDLRPFVCEGSPLACQIFIAGFNPATELKCSFWDFWQLQPIQVEWGTLRVIAVPHLSLGWSERRAREVGQVLRDATD